MQLPKDPDNWVSQKERGSLFWVKFLFRACNLLGRPFCNFLAVPVTAYFVATSARGREQSRKYLSRALAYDSPRSVPLQLVFKHFLAFSFCLIDKVAVWGGRLSVTNCRWHGKDKVRALIDQGKGVILVSAHFGNIEVCRAISQDLRGLKISALMYKQHARKYNNLLKELNSKSQIDVIEVETVGPALITSLQEKLARGESLGLLADRVTPGAPEKIVSVDFFGQRAHFPAGPWILASLLDAPVFLCFAVRTDSGDYEVFFEKFNDDFRLSRNERDSSLRQEVARYAARLEHFCQQYPLQWFNFYDFWQTSKPVECNPPQ